MRLRHLIYFLGCLSLFYIVFSHFPIFIPGNSVAPAERSRHCEVEHGHPVDSFVRDANSTWSVLLDGRTHNVKDGAAAYRARRGRHPPPWFDRWYKKAQSLNVIIIEEFFDQIYGDLEPFWSISPAEIRVAVQDWPSCAKVRNGRVVEIPQDRFRTRVWGDMLKKISSMLPDMDLALNGLDEPRVLAPWETINERMTAANLQKGEMMSHPKMSFVQNFPTTNPPGDVHSEKPKWITKNDQFKKALCNSCSPDSNLRMDKESDTSKLMNSFVHNVTLSSNICGNPSLMEQHGFLIEPASIDFTPSLIPIFSAAKLGINNDILLPEPAYYSDNKLFSGRDWWGDWSSHYSWRHKLHGLVWRGAATGGHVRPDTWRQFHRHRFVSHLNGSNSDVEPERQETMSIKTRLGRKEPVSDWLSKMVDIGFSKILCSESPAENTCSAIHQQYQTASSIKMGQQFKWKYLPDIDGNTLSGRFRAFMRSNSAVMKATIFTEWHDSRLFAWKHYIPLSISFDDLYDVLAYFLGIGNTCAHDFVGETIANDGQKWANAVLRKEDMLVYMHRVLLEYARIVHDERDHLGYVGDLPDS